MEATFDSLKSHVVLGTCTDATKNSLLSVFPACISTVADINLILPDKSPSCCGPGAQIYLF